EQRMASSNEPNRGEKIDTSGKDHRNTWTSLFAFRHTGGFEPSHSNSSDRRGAQGLGSPEAHSAGSVGTNCSRTDRAGQDAFRTAMRRGSPLAARAGIPNCL